MKKALTMRIVTTFAAFLGLAAIAIAGISFDTSVLGVVPLRVGLDPDEAFEGDEVAAPSRLIVQAEAELATQSKGTRSAPAEASLPSRDTEAGMGEEGAVVEALSLISAATAEGSATEETSAAIMVLEKAAEKGDRRALRALGDLYRRGSIVEADAEKAIEFYRRADELGDPRATLALGFMVARGEGATADPELALEYLERAATFEENPAALKLLGDLYRANGSPLYEPAKAREYYRRSAALNNGSAYLALGDMSRAGQGGDRSDENARTYYERALALGNDQALRALGSLYQANDSAIKDTRLAAEYYGRAARQGDEKAILVLAQMYARNDAFSDPYEVISLLDSIARGQDEKNVRSLLGDIYRKDGPAHNLDLAMQNYRRAAALGEGWAMIRLGDILRNASGGDRAAAAAAEYYEAAAKAGVARAYVRLGDLAWQSGHQSREVASIRYYEKAEAQGDVMASLRLAQAQQRHYMDRGNIARAIQRYQTAVSTVGLEQITKHLLDGDPNGLVAIVQVLLTTQGYDVGAVDGLAGTRTIGAIDKFCQEHQIAACQHSVDEAVLEALLTTTARPG